MKLRLQILIFALIICGPIYAQSDSAKAIIRGANDLKTGNSLDVLTNFFQLAAQDLTGNTKSFNFKSTLFAVKLRADSSLNIDYLYKKQRFSRNLQFDFALNTDKDFKFKGFSGGITYALINNRDKTIADFTRDFVNDPIVSYSDDLNDKLNNAITKFQTDVIINIQDANRRKQIEDSIANGSAYFHDDNHLGDISHFPVLFQAYIKPLKLEDAEKRLIRNRDSLMDQISGRALLTVSVRAKSDSLGKIKEGFAEAVYLYGQNVQADIRGNATYRDTVTATSDYRLVIDVKGGADITLLKDKKANKPCLEIKPAFEYNNILKGTLPGEKAEMFSFNTEFRVRVLDQLWLPIILKYDLENHNFLGVFNVSVNLDAFKNFTKQAK